MAFDLPEALTDRWQPLGTRTGETTVMMASITAETTLYEPVESTPLEAVGESDVPVRSLFTVDLTFSPPLPSIGVSPGAVFSMAAPRARSQFVDTVEDEGLIVDGQRDSLAFEGPNGARGKWYVLDVEYPLEGDSYLPAEAHVAVWPTERSYGMAGGTVPLEIDGVDFASGDGSPVGVVDPERDRETIATLIRRLER